MPPTLNTRRRRDAGIGLLLLWSAAATGAEDPATPSLPNPLTLDSALALADAPHPTLERARAAQAGTAADRQLLEADDSWRLDFEGRARLIDPSRYAPDQSNNDSSAHLRWTKRLYDFGRTRERRKALDAEQEGRRLDLVEATEARRLAIMEAYFGVLLADLEFTRDNEAMAAAYVTLDKRRARKELDQLSDIVLLEFERTYQTALRTRKASQARQRAARARLALALDRPGQLSANLAEPTLRHQGRTLEDPNEALARALARNPRLQAEQARLTAAGHRVEAAAAESWPVIRGEVEAAGYNRSNGSRENIGGGLVMEMPIFDGGRRDALVAKGRAERWSTQSELRAIEYEIRDQVMALWQEIEDLRAGLDQLEVEGRYRELYLERSRALYEHEVNTDLGDSMTQISDLNLLRERTRYQLELAWERLDALAGRDAGEAEATKAAQDPTQGEKRS